MAKKRRGAGIWFEALLLLLFVSVVSMVLSGIYREAVYPGDSARATARPPVISVPTSLRPMDPPSLSQESLPVIPLQP